MGCQIICLKKLLDVWKNSVDPDQTLQHLIFVYTVFSGLSVPVLGVYIELVGIVWARFQ